MAFLHRPPDQAVPTISNAMHAHTLYDGSATAIGTMGGFGLGQDTAAPTAQSLRGLAMQQAIYNQNIPPVKPQEETNMADFVSKRRLVKVIIVDPDEAVPLEQCILYSGPEKLTDLTDNELFFEIEIRDILHDHNQARKKIVNKQVKERVEFLEPIRVRDLRMVVVTIASF